MIQRLITELQKYRPHRRPIVTKQKNPLSSQRNQQVNNLFSKKKRNEAETARLQRKKKLVVRDWFFYVVWFVRLRKIIEDSDYSEALLEGNLTRNAREYQKII
jgi:hypothetical protein